MSAVLARPVVAHSPASHLPFTRRKLTVAAGVTVSCSCSMSTARELAPPVIWSNPIREKPSKFAPRTLSLPSGVKRHSIWQNRLSSVKASIRTQRFREYVRALVVRSTRLGRWSRVCFRSQSSCSRNTLSGNRRFPGGTLDASGAWNSRISAGEHLSRAWYNWSCSRSSSFLLTTVSQSGVLAMFSTQARGISRSRAGNSN